MGIEKLDHYAVRTTDLARAIKFYEDALGLHAGPRPPFKFPGAWMYAPAPAGASEGSAVVHLIGTAGADPAATADTGALDHIAFRATGMGDTCARLERLGIAFRQREVPLLQLQQVFIDDPDGVTIELNFPEREQ
jgi:catechol 2,3-dioxygenase-like lactoylglutathione lyase family enzyme